MPKKQPNSIEALEPRINFHDDAALAADNFGLSMAADHYVDITAAARRPGESSATTIM